MEDMKKRKVEVIGNSRSLPDLNDTASLPSAQELCALLDPLAKPQLVDLLARAYLASELATDVVVHGGDFKFYLHMCLKHGWPDSSLAPLTAVAVRCLADGVFAAG